MFLHANSVQMLYQITVAAVLGMLIGFEREHHKKPAGLRTYTLVSLGACLFTIISALANGGGENFSFDPSRIASQVVVGIGFIGGGLILHRGDRIEGLTTAAGLWVTAAVGMAVGFGLFLPAIYATALILSVLWALRYLEDHIHAADKNSSQE